MKKILESIQQLEKKSQGREESFPQEYSLLKETIVTALSEKKVLSEEDILALTQTRIESDVDIKPAAQNTLLHWALLHDYDETLLQLLIPLCELLPPQQKEALLNERDGQLEVANNTPLTLAIKMRKWDTAQRLVELGVDYTRPSVIGSLAGMKGEKTGISAAPLGLIAFSLGTSKNAEEELKIIGLANTMLKHSDVTVCTNVFQYVSDKEEVESLSFQDILLHKFQETDFIFKRVTQYDGKPVNRVMTQTQIEDLTKKGQKIRVNEGNVGKYFAALSGAVDEMFTYFWPKEKAIKPDIATLRTNRLGLISHVADVPSRGIGLAYEGLLHNKPEKVDTYLQEKLNKIKTPEEKKPEAVKPKKTPISSARDAPPIVTGKYPDQQKNSATVTIHVRLKRASAVEEGKTETIGKENAISGLYKCLYPVEPPKIQEKLLKNTLAEEIKAVVKNRVKDGLWEFNITPDDLEVVIRNRSTQDNPKAEEALRKLSSYLETLHTDHKKL